MVTHPGSVEPGLAVARIRSPGDSVRRPGQAAKYALRWKHETEEGHLRSLSEFTYLRARAIVVVTGLALLAAAPFAAGIFSRVEPFDISDPNSEVERAYAAYERATGGQSEPDVLLLIEPPEGAGSRSGAAEVETTVARLAAFDGIAVVIGPSQQRELISEDGKAALIVGFLDASSGRVEVGERVSNAFAADADILPGGTAVAAAQIGDRSERDTRRIEIFVAPILLLLLLLVFRAAVAAALPLILSAVSIIFTLSLLNGLSRLTDIDLFSLQVVTGLGVGLAIDYSLFVLARYRAEIRRGDGYHAAHRRTMATAGRTVSYGALTVAVALAALILFPQQFLSSTGIAGALVALLSGFAALLVLPAVLALLGPRIDPRLETGGSLQDARPDPLGGGSRFWGGLSGRVMAHPLPVATIALSVMLAAGAPALGGMLTTPDARVLPEDQSARMVDDAATKRFPGALASRMLVIVPAEAAAAETDAAESQVAGLDGIIEVRSMKRLPDRSSYILIRASVDPLSDQGQQLLKEVRAAPWPPGTLVGGRAAELADQRASIGSSAPLVVAVIVVTNLLLILIMFRSLVLPLLSIALNALTVIASYGITVALFDNAATAELLGTVAQDGVDVSVPILAFAVVFGLSTDYGIFLFSRIAEARARTTSEPEAITEGLTRSGRLITSAAVIFSVAVGANIFSGLVIVKEFAVAIAVAVLLDATVVRGLLVPSLLRMLGSRAWWWPQRWAPGPGGGKT